MDKKGRLSKTDCRLLGPYLIHLEIMKRDVKTEQDDWDELEWLEKKG